MSETLIAFAGLPGAGKDTCCRILAERHGFKQFSFADPMRRAMAALNPLVATGTRWNDAIQIHGGYDAAKRVIPEMRVLMQRFGTEAGRVIHGPDCWVDIVEREIDHHPRACISDLRFPNEYDMICQHRGFTVWVEGRGKAPNGHVSESFYGDMVFTHTIKNTGSVEDLIPQLDEVVNEVLN